MNTRLYLTTIIHERFMPFHHRFKYFVPAIFIDNNELNILKKNLVLFSINSFNIFSYYEKDHGYRDHRTLEEYVKINLQKYKIKFSILKIKILCFPRIFGYVFNPLSIIYCYDEDKLIAIFYEVKNTSNEQHTYLFKMHKNHSNYYLKHQCKKNFYVSPFIDMKGLYKFTNKMNDAKLSINIDLLNEKNEKVLTASQYGKSVEFNSFTLLKFLSFNPLFGFKVILAILFESACIMFKGGKYYARQKKPIDSISFEDNL